MLSRRPLRLVLPRFRAAEFHIFPRQRPARSGRLEVNVDFAKSRRSNNAMPAIENAAPPPHPARFARLRRKFVAEVATSPPAGPWFNVTVPGMCCLPQRTNASNTSPSARPFGVSV